MQLLSPQLKTFLAVAKYQTVHAAAEAMYLTQTAITQRILTLERRLSTTLFIRSRRGMLLTAEGEALLRYCLQAAQWEGEALSAIANVGHLTTVTITMTGPTTLMHARIIPQSILVSQKMPHLLLQ